ncbi:ATP-binding protein [Streptomyces sp. NPDC060085]|uniref:ATP-binding protein n=1 Tax=Streptomyces sp. NPDC060085 TaxID=3347054 RepID=UPI00365B3A45
MTQTGGRLWERDSECLRIVSALTAAAEGHGAMVLVQGPAGIGKTRLLVEASMRAQDANVCAVTAQASELERDRAFGVVRQLFDPLIVGAAESVRDDLWDGPASRARSVFHSVSDRTDAARTGDFALLHGLYWLAANASQHRPLLMTVDNLQWCDTPSLRFLAYLLPRLDDLPLVIACAWRTGVSISERLLAQLMADPVVHLLEPAPLSEKACKYLLGQFLTEPVDKAFVTACHAATGGNPLLLHALARTIADEHLEPTAANANRIGSVGPRAVGRLTAARLADLPDTIRTLAQVVAVLGECADLATVAALAGQDTTLVLEGVATLERLEILRIEDADTNPRVSFVHPLVRAAVYDTLDPTGRGRWHQRAAQVLVESSAEPERIAAHLLHSPPRNDPDTVALLRLAAATATDRGASASAYTYLRRALAEPPQPDQYQQILTDAGLTALPVDPASATENLQQAYDRTVDPICRAGLAVPLGAVYLFAAPERGLALQAEAIAQLPGDQEDLRRRLQASMLTLASWVVPGRLDLLGDWLDGLQLLPAHDSVGGRLLDSAIAGRNMSLGDPTAVSRARRALADDTLTRSALDSVWLHGWNTLLAADDPLAVKDLEAVAEYARAHGSLTALSQIYEFLIYGWLTRGQLEEAETAAQECQRLADLAGNETAKFMGLSIFADILTEQGRTDRAEQVLNDIGITVTAHPNTMTWLALPVLARLLRLRGDLTGALTATQHAQAVCALYDIRNPAASEWRSEAALTHRALGNDVEARTIATENLGLARTWGAPRTLGRALRVLGVVTESDKGIRHLQEAVTTLQGSPARLEHAKALLDLGAALRDTGRSQAARASLREALDLALQCGATPLAESANAELVAAGGRLRRTALTGPKSLTPSERRVAELAASGATNRHIAQQLYVTPKTVEVHLSAIYRKLGITARTHLAPVLEPSQGTSR